jgi:hypothetical protein
MTNTELKSKVMTLGNKLAPRMGGDRRAAFVEAWAIVKAGGLKVAVRDVSFGNRQEALRRLAAYNPAAIKADGASTGWATCPGPWPRSWGPWAASSPPSACWTGTSGAYG